MSELQETTERTEAIAERDALLRMARDLESLAATYRRAAYASTIQRSDHFVKAAPLAKRLVRNLVQEWI